ncbi:hypothetical protein GQ607_016635 [Colletotrichum asianum]|uniref:Uncharacterized protein n=1 Tax=Colletotrichum asianum TaxID=702518 RepID=A0A8H3W0P7_9PEZI|nr:hypothetical protein GQ607_016635 [Colletotrichum asianum]
MMVIESKPLDSGETYASPKIATRAWPMDLPRCCQPARDISSSEAAQELHHNKIDWRPDCDSRKMGEQEEKHSSTCPRCPWCSSHVMESNFDALHRSSLRVCSRHHTFKHCGTIPSKIACRLQLECCCCLPTLLRLLWWRGFQVLSCLFAANPRLQRTPLLFPRSHLGAAQTFVLSQNFSSSARLGKPQRKSNIRAAGERDTSIAPPFSVSTPRSIPSFVAPHAQFPHHPLQNQLAALPSSAARPSSELRVRIVLSPSNPVSSVHCASLNSSRVLSFPETMNTYVPGYKTTLRYMAAQSPMLSDTRTSGCCLVICTAHGGRRQAETSPYPGELRPHSVKDM